MRVGISGMGRIGRLALRAAMGAAERQRDDPRAGNRLDVVHLNEVKGGAADPVDDAKALEAVARQHGATSDEIAACARTTTYSTTQEAKA